MKKKIGSSKPMKKYAMGGQDGPGDGNDSIPKVPRAVLDKINSGKLKPNDKGFNFNKFNKGSETQEYIPSRDRKKPSTMEYIPSRDDKKFPKEYLKKGGSVSKPKMKMGGSVKKSSSKKK